MEYHGIEFKEDFNLNELSFSNVIDGLNKYFAEAETQRVLQPFVEIKSKSDKVIFYRFDSEMYLDKLITWLRTKHGIFYYPGMESKYAKAEKTIPPFSERMKNDGALNTLKKLHKLVTGDEVSDKADSPTLIAATIENDFAVLKQDLKNAFEAKESFFETKGKLNYRKELMGYIIKTEKKYGIRFSDLHDDEEFRPERIFDDLLGVLKKCETEIKEVNEKRWKDLRDIHKVLGCGGMNGHVDDFAKAVKARAECVFEEHKRYLEQRDKAVVDYQALMAKTKLDTIEKKLEELLKDIKEELP